MIFGPSPRVLSYVGWLLCGEALLLVLFEKLRESTNKLMDRAADRRPPRFFF